ncbi:endo-arabinase [Exophiala viscosa]|uniref:endo-arabinase n=1 Tax=Exophiala viscosa TaxID=2486360 RepID=UPI002192FB86|nr:endo-arabinase [Exophiala viscosa]
MLLASLVFLSGLAVALAAPLHKRQSSSPVIGTNFQDPAVLQLDDGTWIAYAGVNQNPANINVLTATSADFATWVVHDGYDAFPTLPSWAASPGHVWAPDVVQLANGNFVLYYSVATASSPGQHCVAAATASGPQGPFTPVGSAPLFCDLTAGGAIDADGFLDPVTQRQYIVYKVDGNSKGHGGACSNTVAPITPTPLILQEVSPTDGYTFTGDPVTILENDDSDGPNIEAPALTYDSSSGLYVLLYSSECFVTTAYNIRYATSTSITGPYKKAADSFLDTGATAADVYIPGGFDVTKDGKYAVFHGDTNMGWFQGDGSKRVRAMYAIALSLNTGNPAVSKMY